MIYENILDLIGNTPVVKLKFLNDENIADIYVKLENISFERSYFVSQMFAKCFFLVIAVIMGK